LQNCVQHICVVSSHVPYGLYGSTEVWPREDLLVHTHTHTHTHTQHSYLRNLHFYMLYRQVHWTKFPYWEIKFPWLKVFENTRQAGIHLQSQHWRLKKEDWVLEDNLATYQNTLSKNCFWKLYSYNYWIWGTFWKNLRKYDGNIMYSCM
jgi:hypothetical protein